MRKRMMKACEKDVPDKDDYFLPIKPSRGGGIKSIVMYRHTLQRKE